MKNKQLSLDRENLADGFVLGLNPLLSLVTQRKVVLTWSVIFSIFFKMPHLVLRLSVVSPSTFS